jgi:hypothetical protein
MSGFEAMHDDAPWQAAPGGAASDWELAAAAVELGLLRRTADTLPPLPAALVERIGRDAPAFLPAPVTGGSRVMPSSSPDRAGGRAWLGVAGWCTAACLAALLGWQWSGSPLRQQPPVARPLQPSLAERRDALRAEDPAVVTIAWKKAGDDPAVSADPADLEREAGLGDVVWSPTRQEGFMRFHGLAANDPTVAQYQLWIFDADRDPAHPVDGGVFDVPAGADGDVVVRIDPRLPIGRATAFAITVERPGGVVVSSRKRLPLLAALP